MTLEFFSYIGKYASAFVTTFLGFAALFGESHDGKGRLNKRGWIIASGMLASLLLGVAAVYLEKIQDRQRETQQSARFRETLAKEAEALSRLSAVSDSLSRLRVLSETTVTRQASALRGTSKVLSTVQRSSEAQQRLLMQQRRATFETERLLYPFKTSYLRVVIEYDSGDTTSLLRSYADLLRARGTEVLRTAASLLADSSKLYTSGKRTFVTRIGALLVDTASHRVFLPYSGAYLFGTPAANDRSPVLDSIQLAYTSNWLHPSQVGFNAPEGFFYHPDVELRLWEKDVQRPDSLPPTLELAARAPDTAGVVRNDDDHFSTVSLTVDFVREKLRLEFVSTIVYQRGGGMSSLLDFPGSTVVVFSDPICVSHPYLKCQSPESIVALHLGSDYGRGRFVQMPPRRFLSRDFTSPSLQYQFQVADIERYPGEFGAIFDNLGKPLGVPKP